MKLVNNGTARAKIVVAGVEYHLTPSGGLAEIPDADNQEVYDRVLPQYPDLEVYDPLNSDDALEDQVAAQLAALYPQSGATSERPDEDVATGLMYFDTDLGKPVWWDGAGWVDATGTTA